MLWEGEEVGGPPSPLSSEGPCCMTGTNERL